MPQALAGVNTSAQIYSIFGKKDGLGNTTLSMAMCEICESSTFCNLFSITLFWFLNQFASNVGILHVIKMHLDASLDILIEADQMHL